MTEAERLAGETDYLLEDFWRADLLLPEEKKKYPRRFVFSNGLWVQTRSFPPEMHVKARPPDSGGMLND